MANGLNGNTWKLVLGLLLTGFLGEGAYNIHQISKHGERLARVEARLDFLIEIGGIHDGRSGNSSAFEVANPRGWSDFKANTYCNEQIYPIYPYDLYHDKELLAVGRATDGDYRPGSQWRTNTSRFWVLAE